jgi:hypothetical protein
MFADLTGQAAELVDPYRLDRTATGDLPNDRGYLDVVGWRGGNAVKD